MAALGTGHEEPLAVAAWDSGHEVIRRKGIGAWRDIMMWRFLFLGFCVLLNIKVRTLLFQNAVANI